MKRYIARSWIFEIGVYAKTEGEAKRRALAHFLAEVEKDLTVVEASTRSEKCASCQYTYSPENLVRENGEQLCMSCYQDKYGFEELRPEDIPF